ncbi:unnamed protein product [Heterotrigona itama]|uniref:C2H2-type domain-containing protein n=1 Tax=Heterotrigona itama TaxID=395501 RepID=A0A6V7H1G8_9HYME|nr:unnamed protein product [Heterotrigona itama]
MCVKNEEKKKKDPLGDFSKRRSPVFLISVFTDARIDLRTHLEYTRALIPSVRQAYWCRLPVSFETYPCDTCGRQYRRVISLQRHKRLECGKEAQFECVLCHAKFKHKHSLLRHYNVHVADVKKSAKFKHEKKSA